MGQQMILNQTFTAIIAAGVASVSFGPQLAREQWNINTITVTSLGMTVSVSQYGQVVDSTANDPRPTVTDNTPFLLMSGNRLTVNWVVGTSGVANGTQVLATVVGTRKIGGDVTHAV